MISLSPMLPRNLDNNLQLRWATSEDIEALATFNAAIHASRDGSPNPRIAARTRAWMDGSHPTMRAEKFMVVIERTSGRIVSSLALMQQPWSYGRIPIQVGQIEFVGTHPDYRRRGLVRHQFEAAHQASRAQGDIMQVITGIPWYYRQFGYELALDLGAGRSGTRGALAAVLDQSHTHYQVRAAIPEDLSLIAKTDAYGRQRSLLACERDAALWRYELDGRVEPNIFKVAFQIIETVNAMPVGFFAHAPHFREPTRWITQAEVAADVSWLDVMPAILTYLANALGEIEGWDSFGFWLGTEHPLYQVLPHSLPVIHPPKAWYIRVENLPAFLQHIASLLETRLATSVALNYSGTLRISFFRHGLHLHFEKGRLAAVEAWPHPTNQADATFPDLTFLQLLMGYRSLAELEYAFADCHVSTEIGRVLLTILFPKLPSNVWWLG